MFFCFYRYSLNTKLIIRKEDVSSNMYFSFLTTKTVLLLLMYNIIKVGFLGMRHLCLLFSQKTFLFHDYLLVPYNGVRFHFHGVDSSL